ncbi:sugar kinase [Georgenia satyanarayanai]|uniref:sugar kinase n=1 Tax=Georgenia satyanarayanai TaxID=860221 RepID=UPI00203B992D|nr:sugar kinase [Georgenia satyanarayanai]MCM3659778.1 sugar kinase [Georgenia satyanarayanai]
MVWPPQPSALGTTLDVVGVGEPMLLLQADPPTTLTTATSVSVDVAGAEYNVCAAVARLGGRTALLTRLGDDVAGRRVLAELSRLGISADLVDIDPERPTGLFLRETPPDGSRQVAYYRRGSAAAAMIPTDAARLWSDRVPRAVVLSGITAALGPGPRSLLEAVAARAQEHGIAVVVDANLRPGLGQVEAAVATLRRILPRTDLLVLGDDESGPLLGATTPDDVLAAAARAGVGETVLKGGERGSWYLGEDGVPHHCPTRATDVVDTVGAGDAFLGGYLGARLAGAPAGGAAWLGSELAAAVIAVPGDTGGLPSGPAAASLLTKVRRSATPS